MGLPSVALKLDYCNQCGLCCQQGCHVVPTDVPKMAKRLGISRHEVFGKLHFFPVINGDWAVKTATNDKGCVFLKDNQCSIQQAKPQGGREYECWTPKTFAPGVASKYLWQQGQLP